MTMNTEADYIIAGTGCAGLSLALRLKRSALAFKRVILVDKEQKQENDRTWCFWSKDPSDIFLDIVYKNWTNFEFRSASFNKNFNLQPYTYQLIRGIDFYNYCLHEIKQDSRFELVYDEIESIESEGQKAILKTKKNSFTGSYIFNSALRKLNVKATDVNYIQHFKGWLVETKKAVFNPALPVFMDFSASPEKDCLFFYLLPFSETKALIEFTGFSKNALPEEAYHSALEEYIKTFVKENSYEILETESGKIPMYESRFINPYGPRVINIGTNGGSSKPSTGYTFHFIQQHSKQIVEDLVAERAVKGFLRKPRHFFYDSLLMSVMDSGKILPALLFTDLFRKNRIEDILAFLNEESSFSQELRIMNSVQRFIFIQAAVKKIVQRIL